MLAVLAMAAIGVYSYQKLPIDAVPDITNVQVQINTSASGYSPLEVEQRVTFPIETVMAGLPNLEQTRSLSRYGLSQVTVIFKDGTDIYFARQLVNQRIQEAKENLPQGVVPMMGPISTGLGEIYLWTVESEPNAKSLTARRTLRLTCARSRTGSSSRNCARWKVSLKSTRSVAMPRNITSLLTL
jgi:cobalt-zinc-cadmium resistance protein CzcA